jgi:hypothetical protein
MNKYSYRIINLLVMIVFTSLLLACNEKHATFWQIGGNLAKHKTLVNSNQLKKVKVCSDYYKNIGFPVHLNIHYDDKIYYGLLEGLCITVQAKKVDVRFANPASGKVAKGTFEIL